MQGRKQIKSYTANKLFKENPKGKGKAKKEEKEPRRPAPERKCNRCLGNQNQTLCPFIKEKCHFCKKKSYQ